MSTSEDLIDSVADVAVIGPSPTHEPVSNEEETLESMLHRHRLEQRDLQSTISNMRKSVPKSDKRKKRAMTSKAAELESELRQKQELELTQLKSLLSGKLIGEEETPDDGISLDRLTFLTEEEEPVAPMPSPALTTPKKKKPNKHDLKKQRREEELQKIRDEAEKEASGQVDMGELESEAIKELLAPMKLKVQEISPDGHCLYNSIAKQLEYIYNEETDYHKLRKEAAQYMREHPNDFIPFLYKDDGNIFSADDFKHYCDDVENSPRWGGQLEILALSKAKKVPIYVVQMGSPVLKVGEEEFTDKKPLIVAYYKHLYSLGAHYNSLLKV
ncbi:hypothetical protein J3Q64DRAFT_1708644 [Phycomyces blakesleeanus]|uniref:OTU domain-containing protein n=2 Tax=Phycomyces blakesleeanus TaxID=4837 RepID=A0A167P4X9_PHYB8|nr:hypothetical protein PHYBLDRAFT_122264 [Phycomyces blakesleeanus NRRL 1555(-)]OAD77254.1 hypothetical protein PHYBLDRAFT_122264 [Phycomyces blakesleeanus NRRL 1555(-)]|eukprot:XP_018295294.1 hypothetical protein PHYBLDRAFT_122264 [Phycomyces blakesleeanus NRRL 1555(-)]